MRSKILLVEDEPDLKHSVSELLALGNFEVETASNGHEAMQVLEHYRPDVIVCDVMMPVMDGIAFSERIRGDIRYFDIPLIFLTAKIEDDDVRAGMNAGADDYLKKPVRGDDLISAIQTRIKRNEFRVMAEMHKEYSGARGQLDETEFEGLLTKTEIRVLKKISEGKTTAEIADELFISPKTAENHRYNISKKLNLSGNNALLHFVIARMKG